MLAQSVQGYKTECSYGLEWIQLNSFQTRPQYSEGSGIGLGRPIFTVKAADMHKWWKGT